MTTAPAHLSRGSVCRKKWADALQTGNLARDTNGSIRLRRHSSCISQRTMLE